ncbi:PQQ-dependent sugar dehydrogenase [Prauserella endophytica]|uniref:PKD domain-containing protein n=1 Tax=Prauserella endophytica TaxID=1592324 RepID=A0ABY2S351_9PSEU|nr:PQQ-dependent sugar dehydrogenase [Prauserella endophytica]TKG69918.1 PKD domain-containing protein [Prauserella endophytica]
MSSAWKRSFSRAFALFGVTLMAVGLLVGFAPRQAAAAPALPDGFVLRDQQSGQDAFDLTDFAYLPDGSVLTTGKRGKLAWVSADGSRTRTVATLPVEPVQDMGLVGLAVAPDYETSRKIYLARSVPTGGGAYNIRLAAWTVTGSGEPTGITGETTLLQVPGDATVHGITGIIAAADGTLWVSIGDVAHFVGTDTRALRALDVNAVQGKILHILPNGNGVPGNPYYDAANPGSARSKVFASGFRSPFRFSLDPRTGHPVVGDVGYQTWEEVDLVKPGASYGWPCWEGNSRTPGYSSLAACTGVGNTPPLVAYRHGSAIDQGNSVTGGVFYTGTSYPEQYRNTYFFGDYVGKKLWTMQFTPQGTVTRPIENPPFGLDIGGPVKFATGPGGDIVYADILSGQLRRLSYVPGNSEPVAKASTSTDPATRTVTFDASESIDYDGDRLTYRWDFGDGTTGTGVRATHTYPSTPDRFTARLTVTDQLGLAASLDITVVPGNYAPVITPVTPEGLDFAVGEQVRVTVNATDAEDGPLDVEWTSAVVHCAEEDTCHVHSGPAAAGPTITMPFTDHPDSRMEFTAKATDSDGVSTTYTYVAAPREHRVTLTSNVPTALQMPDEGVGGSTAMVTEGALLKIEAAVTASDGLSKFARWTDGPATASRTITMGDSDLTLNAEYTTPVQQRYDSDPGLRSVLGSPVGPEVIEGGVYYRPYANGRLYWSASTGTKAVIGAIHDKYVALGAHRTLGPPMTDETATPDRVGRYNHFAGLPGGGPASVYWTPSTGAHGIWGEIRKKWASLGWENGPLGYPTTDETATPDGRGRYNHFSKTGSIYWTAATGAHGIWGEIRKRWAALGWENGPLGYPTTDERVTPDGRGRYNHFSKTGSIYWTAGTGARDIYGAIRTRWAALGWERSYLGYPTSGEFAVTGGRRNNFQHGYIQWTAATGAVIDRRY